MDLTTKCPQCQTIFRASLEQLQLRKGYVRCIHCAHIFDGYEAVVSTEPDTAPDSMAGVGQMADVAVSSTSKDGRVPTRREFIITNLATPEVIHGDKPDTPLHTVGSLEDLSISREPVLGAATQAGEGEPIRADRPRQVDSAPRVDDAYDPRGYLAVLRWLWQVLILAGLLIFLAQLVLVFRVQLAETFPGTRPLLERMCGELGCRVAYPRQIDQIHVVQSSLKAMQTEAAEDDLDNNDGSTELSATEAEFMLEVALRNDYAGPQEWPALTLELTDAVGARIARRHIQASEYLPQSVADGPFPARSEYRVLLPLSLRGLNVNGFKVQPFFP